MKPFKLLALLAAVAGMSLSCNKNNLPDDLEWSVLRDPSRLPILNGKVALVYEVLVKNASIESYSFEALTVTDGSTEMLDLTGNDLDSVISVYHSTEKTLKAGETAFLFIWVELDNDAAVPATLRQEIRFTRLSDSGNFTKEMEVNVRDAAPVVLSAPLLARRYAAVGAPANDSYHRRTINYLDGSFYTSDRYAIDFIGLDAGERYREGRQNANIDYYGYDDVVYSATAGEVVLKIDTISENIPPQVPEIDPSALYRTGGNQLMIKVSEGVYVFYGHLVRGSIGVKVGDRVEAGQPLGRLGNSGNCDSPQLHLQVCDGPDPLKSHGLPWVFDRIYFEGSITGYDQTNGLVKVNYLNIRQELSGRNLKGDGVVSFE